MLWRQQLSEEPEENEILGKNWGHLLLEEEIALPAGLRLLSFISRGHDKEYN